MYIPSHFAEHQPEQLHRIMVDNPLGILVRQGDSGLDADHLPFEWDAKAGAHGQLSAHIARANPLWQRGTNGTPVLVIFRGANAYISPNWYPSKHETHRQVPTWNYEVVHAHGRLRVMDEGKLVRRMVALLSHRHEASECKPWKMGDAPRAYIEEMLQHIVGIEIDITRLEGKRKLSQNKESRDRASVIENLRARDQEAMASAIEQAGSRASESE